MKLTYDAKYEDIGTHGQMVLGLTIDDFKNAGIEFQDLVKVSFLDKTLSVPFVPSYRCIHSGGTSIIPEPGNKDGKLAIMSFHSNFVTKNRIAVFLENDDREIDIMVAKNINFPITFTFELDKKGGYAEEFKIYDLKRSRKREDYPNLSDEEYCNFRNICVGSMKPNMLYRSSTPIDPTLGRAKYADAALKKYGIKSIINLCDSEEKAKSYEGYDDTYYSKQKIVFLNTNADVASYNFGKSIVRAVRFMLENEPPFLIHCMEGQDRTGAICAILESTLGASKNELIDDYMKTYENFYGVKKDSEQYMHIARGELQQDIASLRGFSYGTLDILKSPETYLIFLDLFEPELDAFKKLFKR